MISQLLKDINKLIPFKSSDILSINRVKEHNILNFKNSGEKRKNYIWRS